LTKKYIFTCFNAYFLIRSILCSYYINMDEQNRFYFLYESEDTDGILKRIPQLIASGDKDAMSDMEDIIYDLHALWETDYTYKKVAVSDHYLKLVVALERITGKRQADQKGKYYRFKVEEAFRDNKPEQGHLMAKKCEKFFLEAFEDFPGEYYPFKLMADLYSILWKYSTDAGGNYFMKATEMLQKGAKYRNAANHFFRDYFFLLFQGIKDATDTGLQKYIESEMEIFMLKSMAKAAKEASFSRKMISYFNMLDLSEEIDSKFDDYRLFFLEKGIETNYETNQDATEQAHHYAREGKRLGRLDFLEHALNLYRQSLKSKNFHALMHVYIAQTLEAMAEIYQMQGNEKKHQALHQQIEADYLNNFDRLKDNFSFCAHATDYFTNKLFAYSIREDQMAWLKKIKPHLLETEKKGQGFYWTPYRNLILSSYLENDLHASKIWAKKAYLLFNTIIIDKFEQLEAFFQAENCPEMESYIGKILVSIKNLFDTGFYDRKLSYEDIDTITDVEI
jgi:hypothetical protein